MMPMPLTVRLPRASEPEIGPTKPSILFSTCRAHLCLKRGNGPHKLEEEAGRDEEETDSSCWVSRPCLLMSLHRQEEGYEGLVTDWLKDKRQLTRKGNLSLRLEMRQTDWGCI